MKAVIIFFCDYGSQGAFSEANIDEWKQKLAILLHDEGKQELVLREKKVRRDFEQIKVVASRMGLYRYLP